MKSWKIVEQLHVKKSRTTHDHVKDFNNIYNSYKDKPHYHIYLKFCCATSSASPPAVPTSTVTVELSASSIEPIETEVRVTSPATTVRPFHGALTAPTAQQSKIEEADCDYSPLTYTLFTAPKLAYIYCYVARQSIFTSSIVVENLISMRPSIPTLYRWSYLIVGTIRSKMTEANDQGSRGGSFSVKYHSSWHPGMHHRLLSSSISNKASSQFLLNPILYTILLIFRKNDLFLKYYLLFIRCLF